MISAATFRTAVGIIGNALSLILFLSPVPTFRRICKTKSVEQFSPAPYLATLLNCMLWVVYGIPLVHPNSTLVITINGAGTAIELTYVVLFLAYSQGKLRLRVFAVLAAEVAFVGLTAGLVIGLLPTHERRSLVVGIICIFFGTLMYVAPLAVMKLVIKTKSVEYMPLFLSLASFFNGVCWTAYALLRFDLFITIPNSLGVIFSIAQLVLHILYYKSTKQQLEARKKAPEIDLTEVVVKEGGAQQKGRH
ncbi:bidirectional sugar transporter SWEET4-like [Phalaenopsis equestris]|uniref:bidirectional sugar transporter SWEET4-like n=1 Tax=Phalaenopsis equestris TaxID=78828 RepID=UPI0009E1EB4D|nr:bidirectional sugar transporter SWEET4-like [Phalaenopsis equestris]